MQLFSYRRIASLASLGIDHSAVSRQIPNSKEIGAIISKLTLLAEGGYVRGKILLSPTEVADILENFAVPGGISFRSSKLFLEGTFKTRSAIAFVQHYLEAIHYPCYAHPSENIVSIPSLDVLADIYTPGVGYICLFIQALLHEAGDLRQAAMSIANDRARQLILFRANELKNIAKALLHTNLIIHVRRDSNLDLIKAKIASLGNAVYVVTDGTAILGLGDLGPEAGAPVMTGKALLITGLTEHPAIGIILDSKEPKEIVRILRKILPQSGGSINLEDLSSPHSFETERELQQSYLSEATGQPVFDDDQWGTGIVALAALINAAKILNKPLNELVIHFQGAGAGAIGVARILIHAGVRPGNIQMADSKGLIYEGRGGLDEEKSALAKMINSEGRTGEWRKGLDGANVYLGLSAAEPDKRSELTTGDLERMAEQVAILAMANPYPEFLKYDARTGFEPIMQARQRFLDSGRVAVIGSGRADAPNGVNNVSAFPGLHDAGIQAEARRYTLDDYVAAGRALADLTPDPSADNIIVSPLNDGNVPAVSAAVQASIRTRQG